jgi:hypothetical protein
MSRLNLPALLGLGALNALGGVVAGCWAPPARHHLTADQLYQEHLTSQDERDRTGTFLGWGEPVVDDAGYKYLERFEQLYEPFREQLLSRDTSYATADFDVVGNADTDDIIGFLQVTSFSQRGSESSEGVAFVLDRQLRKVGLYRIADGSTFQFQSGRAVLIGHFPAYESIRRLLSVDIPRMTISDYHSDDFYRYAELLRRTPMPDPEVKPPGYTSEDIEARKREIRGINASDNRSDDEEEDSDW